MTAVIAAIATMMKRLLGLRKFLPIVLNVNIGGNHVHVMVPPDQARAIAARAVRMHVSPPGPEGLPDPAREVASRVLEVRR